MRKPLPPALRTLGSAGRIRLAQALWAGIPVDFDALAAPPEDLAELRRRVAEYDADPSTGIPWEDVRANLYRRFRVTADARYEAEWEEEIGRRLKAYENGTMEAIPADEVMRRVRRWLRDKPNDGA